MPTTSQPDVWSTIADEAERESSLWRRHLRPRAEQERSPVFSSLGDEAYALGLETIYEGYLAHYGRPRLFGAADRDTLLLLGDYLYAHGLVRVSQSSNVEAVADLAELISLCAQLRAEEHSDADGSAWAATAALLGSGSLEPAREALRRSRDPAPLLELAEAAAGLEAVERALAAHRERVG